MNNTKTIVKTTPAYQAGRIRGAAFVRAWQRAESTTEVINKLGITKKQAFDLSARFRKYGVPLKKLKAAKTYNFTALAELAKSLHSN